VHNSLVCGPGGNFSAVSDWTRINNVFWDNLGNPFGYQEIRDTFIKISDWLGPDGDYWGQECGCVEQLIVQLIDEEVLEQSGDFDNILTHDITDWCDLFEDGMEELMFDKTIEISEKLRNILGNIQNNLKATPERSALVTMDIAVVSSMTMLGMMSRAIMANVEPCMAIQLAGQELLTIQNLVDFSIKESRFVTWPSQVALCSVNLPETYDQCQPPLPWPHYWVQDNYLGSQPFFGMQEEAEIFLSNYVGSVERSVNSLLESVETDMQTLNSAYRSAQTLEPDYCTNIVSQ